MKSPIKTNDLIQIIPNTTTHTMKIFSIPDYNNPKQLLNPKTNININTNYLQYIYQQFNNNRIFSSTTYNAEPKQIQT